MLDKPEIGSPCNGCGICCVTTVCCAGSYALGLVRRWGERARGPCPALVEDSEKLVCGILLHPTDWLNVERGSTVLRYAFGLLVGVGAGCEESSNESDASAQPKIDALHAAYLAAHPADELHAAVDMIKGYGCTFSC